MTRKVSGEHGAQARSMDLAGSTVYNFYCKRDGHPIDKGARPSAGSSCDMGSGR